MLSFFNHLLFITLMNIKSLTKPDLKKKFVLFFNFDNQMGMGWDLCVGLLYGHRFAMLIMMVMFIKDGGSTAGLPPCNKPKDQQSNYLSEN